APQSEPAVLGLQDPQPERVEGADEQVLRVLAAEAPRHAFAHLAGGLVGEGDRGDPPGRHGAYGDEVGDLLDDDAGLAAPRAGKHEQRTIAVRNGVALRWVQAGHASIIPPVEGEAEWRRGA